jgi:hypothetical protein
MGRPVLLRATTTTTPLPSTLEADEYELWPPPSVSIGQKSRSRSGTSQMHIQPMKSRTMTCFNATVRLAYIVEQCLDLDNELLMSATTSTHNESRQLVVMDNAALQEEMARIEKQKAQLARKLTDWWDRLDPDLRVDFHAKICPPIHFVVNCCVSNLASLLHPCKLIHLAIQWYYSATIFLHSKNIGSRGISGSRSELYLTSHRICSEAAGNIVTLLSCLDTFHILAPASSDIILFSEAELNRYLDIYSSMLTMQLYRTMNSLLPPKPISSSVVCGCKRSVATGHLPPCNDNSLKAVSFPARSISNQGTDQKRYSGQRR